MGWARDLGHRPEGWLVFVCMCVRWRYRGDGGSPGAEDGM
jgi:hypothetical protein